jgi:hypothetical protein
MWTRILLVLTTGLVSVLAVNAEVAASAKPETYAGDFHLESSEVRRATLECKLSVKTPEKRVARWILVYPVPSDTGSQRIHDFRLAVGGQAVDWSKQEEKSPLVRNVSVGVVDKAKGAGVPGELDVTASYDVTVLKRRLVPGRPSDSVAELSDSEKRVFTEPTPTCDYDDPNVQRWIRKHDLSKRKQETVLEFSFRAFCALQELLRYELPTTEPDFFNCSRTIRTSTADCGASNLLFAAVMRNSGIPARVYCGRWLRDSGEEESNSHSLGEFFVSGVGWIPVDATAPLDAQQNNMWKFGQDSGRYLATSMGTDWEIPLPRQGVRKLIWLHHHVAPDLMSAGRKLAGYERKESTRLLETTNPATLE